MSKNIFRVKDLTGQKFGNLTVIGLHPTETKHTYWICQCDCGNIKVVRSDSLQSGRIRSCGCLKKQQDKVNLSSFHSHLQSGTRLYYIWQGMKGRCYNSHDVRYDRYGARGIKVCDEWKDNFQRFYEWALKNGYRDDLTIERQNNDLGYSPDNCKWATNKEQANNRSTNIKIKIGNSTRNLSEWCEIFHLDSKKVYARYNRYGFISIDYLFNSD